MNSSISAFLTDPPGAPSGPEFTEITKSVITFSWQPPEFNGGSPITGYYIERRQTSSTRWVKITKKVVTEITYSDTEVLEDNEYEYRIIAENKIGKSEPGPSSKAVTAKDPWGKQF